MIDNSNYIDYSIIMIGKTVGKGKVKQPVFWAKTLRKIWNYKVGNWYGSLFAIID